MSKRTYSTRQLQNSIKTISALREKKLRGKLIRGKDKKQLKTFLDRSLTNWFIIYSKSDEFIKDGLRTCKKDPKKREAYFEVSAKLLSYINSENKIALRKLPHDEFLPADYYENVKKAISNPTFFVREEELENQTRVRKLRNHTRLGSTKISGSCGLGISQGYQTGNHFALPEEPFEQENIPKEEKPNRIDVFKLEFSAEMLKKIFDAMCPKEKEKFLSEILKEKNHCQKDNKNLFEDDCDESGKYKMSHSCQKEDERYYSYTVDCEVEPFFK